MQITKTVSVEFSDGQKVENIKNHYLEVVRALYNRGAKIVAIKFMRSAYGLTLYNAKELCDAIADSGAGAGSDPFRA